MMKHFYLLYLVSCAALFSGCGDSSRPKDLPKLYPCTITMTQDGAPLAEAAVELIPQPPAEAKYRAAAITGADGSVTMTTYGFPGVPQGKYKVVVTKNIAGDEGYAENPATGAREVVSFKKYRTVEPQYSSADSTPLELEITGKGKTVQTFDAGKAVKTMYQ